MALELTINGVNNPPSSDVKIAVEFFDLTFIEQDTGLEEEVCGEIIAIYPDFSDQTTLFIHPYDNKYYNLSEMYPSGTLILIASRYKDNYNPEDTLNYLVGLYQDNYNAQVYINNKPWKCLQSEANSEQGLAVVCFIIP